MTNSSDPNADEGSIVRLAPVCGIRTAAELKQELVSKVDAIAPVLIDAGAVERIDTTTLQLLYAFIRDRTKEGSDIEWGPVSAVFREAVECLGVPLGLKAGA
jgi:anti-anti-sigma regulatory factor